MKTLSFLLFVTTFLISHNASALRTATCPCLSADGVRQGNTEFNVCAGDICTRDDMRREIQEKHLANCMNDFGGRNDSYRIKADSCKVE